MSCCHNPKFVGSVLYMYLVFLCDTPYISLGAEMGSRRMIEVPVVSVGHLVDGWTRLDELNEQRSGQ